MIYYVTMEVKWHKVGLTHLFYLCSCRKYPYGSCKAIQLSAWKVWGLTHSFSNLKLTPCLRVTSAKSNCLGSLVNPDGAAASDWIPAVDQVLLMASMFLTYVSGIAPVRKSSTSRPKKIYSDYASSESSNSSGR